MSRKKNSRVEIEGNGQDRDIFVALGKCLDRSLWC